MNFADAIREAAKQAAGRGGTAQGPYVPPDFSVDKETTMAYSNEHDQTTDTEIGFGAVETDETFEFAVDAVTSEQVPMPSNPNSTVRSGNVVRLELFLSPEQLNSLFRALVATQHGMLTLREAAQYLRVHPTTVEQMAQDGHIPALMIEGRWRFPKSSLDEWLNLQVFKKGESNAA